MKKTLLLHFFVSIGLLTIAQVGLAAENPLTGGSNNIAGGMDVGMAALTSEIKGLYQQGFQFINAQNYQADPNLNALMQLNGTLQSVTIGNHANDMYAYNNVNPNQLAAANAQALTQNNIDNTLNQLRYAYYPNTNTTFQTYLNNNSNTALSGVQNNPNPSANAETDASVLYNADDSLAMPKQNESSLYEMNASNLNGYLSYLKESNSPQNSMLNFSALITPTVYNPTQLDNAKNYVKFATQDTVNLFPKGLYHFDQMTVNALSPKQQVEALYTLKRDPAYQSFKVNLRSLIAQRSASSGILNYLIAERTPVAGLGKALGAGDTAASPLQVEAYRANHRIQDPNWYKRVETYSPATVQRHILMMLAEIEHQNYEAHIDRERILAALAMSNVATNQQLMKTYLQTAATNVNKSIQNAIHAANPSQPAAAVSQNNEVQNEAARYNAYNTDEATTTEQHIPKPDANDKKNVKQKK